MRVHVERIEVYRRPPLTLFRPVVDVPGYGTVAGPAVVSKSIAKKAAHLIRQAAPAERPPP